jgi:hypothetical protein
MTVIAMSRTEIDRMSVLHDLADGAVYPGTNRDCTVAGAQAGHGD